MASGPALRSAVAQSPNRLLGPFVSELSALGRSTLFHLPTVGPNRGASSGVSDNCRRQRRKQPMSADGSPRHLQTSYFQASRRRDAPHRERHRVCAAFSFGRLVSRHPYHGNCCSAKPGIWPAPRCAPATGRYCRRSKPCISVLPGAAV